MTMRIKFSAIIWVCALVSGPLARGEVYRDPDRHFYLELPPAWQVMPAETLDLINTMAAKMPPRGMIHYIQGFMPLGGNLEDSPYILVQHIPADLNGISYEQIEREYNVETKRVAEKLEVALSDVGSGCPVSKAILDRTKNQVILTSSSESADTGLVGGVSVGFFSSEGTLFVHCYDLESHYSKSAPLFKAMLESFKLDPGFEFKPGPAGLLNADVIRGGLLVLVLVVVSRLLRRVLFARCKRQLQSQELSTGV
jgi:hypothetical protein